MSQLFIIFIISIIMLWFIKLDIFENNLIPKYVINEYFTIESTFKMPDYIPKKYRELANKLLELGHQIDKDSKFDCDMTEYLSNEKLLSL